jgi:hypothetical protein
MSNRTATPSRASQRGQAARRGAPSGRLVVGEYVGQAAADAAQAVRRAGLRPGLDRSFGCEAELIGLIVAQEPAAGSEQARNGMVTLYVAAPGNAPVGQDTDAPETLGDPPASASAAAARADVAQADAPSAPARARRPRKPGRAVRVEQVFDPPPAPVPVDQGGAGEAQAPTAPLPPAQTWGSPGDTYAPDIEEPCEGVFDERGEDELSHEEFVVHMDDVFAGRAGGPPAWRRVYPRRRTAGALGGGRGVRARLAEHPWLVRAVGGMLAVWAVVGVAAALAGHPTSTKHAHVASTVAQRAATQTTSSSQAPYALTVRTVRPRAIPARTHHRPRARRARRHRPRPVARPASSVDVVVPDETTSAPTPVVTQPAQRQSSAESNAVVEFGPER